MFGNIICCSLIFFNIMPFVKILFMFYEGYLLQYCCISWFMLYAFMVWRG